MAKALNINITIPTPYVSLTTYSEMTGIPLRTCEDMVSDGRIIIRPKKARMGKVEVNLVAMLRDAIANSEI